MATCYFGKVAAEGPQLMVIYFLVLGRFQHISEGTLHPHCSLGGKKKAGTPEGRFRHRRMLVDKLLHRTPEGTFHHHYIQADKLPYQNRSERQSEHACCRID